MTATRVVQTKTLQPSVDETQDDFMERCVSAAVDDGESEDDAIEICGVAWEEKTKAARPRVQRATRVYKAAPAPSVGEAQDEFMERCVPNVVESGASEDEATALCVTAWREKRVAAWKTKGAPVPNAGETEADFMERCVGGGVASGVPEDRATELCTISWNDNGEKSAKAKAAPRMVRAWSVFTTKKIDDEHREIEGVATTPTVDRMGDIVTPDGAVFKLPIALLWQHHPDQPVGEVYAAKSTKDGISIKARIFKAVESENLKKRFDEAWESVKLKLVRGLSIGFAPLQVEAMKDSMGNRYSSWEWLELSLVTIPANVDASIAHIKSIDSKLLAASGHGQRTVTYKPAGVSASSKEAKAVNIPEQISQLETTRGAKVARLNALTEKAAAAGRTKDQAEKEEFDTLSDEIESIDSELTDQRRLEKINLSAAKVINTQDGTKASTASPARSPYITVERRLPKGTAFTRYVMALARTRNNLYEAMEYSKRWEDSTPEVTTVLKAAVAAGTTSDATWASLLVDYTNMASEFVDLLRPLTILGKFGVGGIPDLRRVPFNIRMTTQTTGGSYGWVGEGAPKPVSKLGIGEITLKWAKAAGIIVVTDELMRFSSPNVEQIVRNDMLKGMALFSDQQFIDPDFPEVANVSPASITYGAPEINPTGTSAAALRTDLGTLFNRFWTAGLAPTTGVFVMSNRLATKISLMRNALGQKEFPDMTILGGTLEGFPVIASEAVDPHSGGDILVFLNADDIFYADDGPVTIDASREASLQMDTAPTNPATASTVFLSLWQMNMIALRAERYMNWKKRRAAAVAYIDNANYGA